MLEQLASNLFSACGHGGEREHRFSVSSVYGTHAFFHQVLILPEQFFLAYPAHNKHAG